MLDTKFKVGLNKDKPNRDGHTEAINLFQRQIENEWCRIVNLVRTNFGQEALDILFQD
jgi:hypothetical protein